MAPNPKVAKAFNAMKALGIPEETVRPVLRKLLKVYDKKWELIEEENYRVLADAIFEYQEDKEVRKAKQLEEAQLGVEAGSSSHLNQHEDQGSLGDDLRTFSDETSLMRKKREDGLPKSACQDEEAQPSQLCLGKRKAEPEPILPKLQIGNKRKDPKSPQIGHINEIIETKSSSSQTHLMNKGKEAVQSPEPCTKQEKAKYSETPTHASSLIASREKRIVSEGSLSVFHDKDVTPGTDKFHNQCCLDYSMIKPKSEPYTDEFSQIAAPLAVIYPPADTCTTGRVEDQMLIDSHSTGDDISDKTDALEYAALQYKVGKDEGHCSADTECETEKRIEIASSPLGEVKISLTCNFARKPPNFYMPSLDEVMKLMEDKCLSYKILDPNFSLMNLMKELCQGVLQMATTSTENRPEDLAMGGLNLLKKFNVQNDFGVRSNLYSSTSSSNDPLGSAFGSKVPSFPALNNLDFHRAVQPEPYRHGETSGGSDKKKHLQDPQLSTSQSLVVLHKQNLALDDEKPLHNVVDICKGEEKVKITVSNDINSEPYPLKFYYIPQNIVYQNAYVNFSLARIGDENCCMNCFGDCMSSSIPCACARETGGEFAYTPEGLVREQFLDECISLKDNPLDHHFFYCKECPLERLKNEDLPDPCKGHLVKKFIKECWSKCGCDKYCGNRVVQRGITRNLQVFLTSQGKGWGLRTLEYLPKGTFVCEYVGEILTNTELYERNAKKLGNQRHTYPVLLDSDWGSEGVLKDEEALCLDATFYGNVARFINHRCDDANLVDIPVEIETPDHHYYHLAFFTTRDVAALEELTWDYGIDFEDQNHPIKAFLCRCESKGCRDKRRRKRSKQKALILR